MRCTILVVAIAIAVTSSGHAAADDPVVWSVAGQQVLRLRAPYKSLTPEQRVEQLDERLTEMLSVAARPIGPADICLKVTSKETVSITINGKVLVTVSAADAAANHCSPRRLAEIWLANVRKTVPLLNPRENRGGA
jgi:hypothetical protein